MNIWGMFFSFVFIPSLLLALIVITYISEKEDYNG